MTARSDDRDVSPDSAAAGGEIWGTLEELLLACAVSRHGTASWDAVAMEVQSRTTSAARFTPESCRLRCRLLHRRFAAAGGNGDGDEGEPDATAAHVWVEELRKLRVAELRREVEQYDLSIGSLQSKVKRLKEERKKSFSVEAKPVFREEERKGSREEAGVEDRVAGEETGRSCKESNSSDLKWPGDDTAAVAKFDDPAAGEEAAAGEVDVKEEASGESVAGSKEAAGEVAVKEEASGESAARSKESSDVQSSASLSRRRQQKGVGEEASASVPLPAEESEPLLALLESVRTSKPGSVFERRLESQEGARYRATIRRHVDLEMIRSKLEGGGAACYASTSEFYRDLLLLCANALVFFPRGSPEHAAATQTRALVSNHIIKDSSGKAVAAASKKKTKEDADIAVSLLEKAAPIIVCRKRSSVAKAAAAAAKEVKEEKAETGKKDKDNEGKKSRGLRTNKSRGPVRNAPQNQKKSSESAEGTKKSDKKGDGGAAAVAKKRNAVDFLNRINQNGSPSTERVSLLETLKLSAAATEQKKPSSSGKGDGRKDHPGSSGSKKAADTPAGRRNIGRPPKRAAAPPTPPPSKRAKDDKSSRKRGKK